MIKKNDLVLCIYEDKFYRVQLNVEDCSYYIEEENYTNGAIVKSYKGNDIHEAFEYYEIRVKWYMALLRIRFIDDLEIINNENNI